MLVSIHDATIIAGNTIHFPNIPVNFIQTALFDAVL